MGRKCFLDLETTGLVTEYCQIIEVAASVEVDGKDVYFHEYIKPSHPITTKITMLTGITNDMVSFCRSEKEVLESLISWLVTFEADVIVAHNSSFDMRFLVARSAKTGVSNDFFNTFQTFDTLKFVRRLLKEGKFKTLDGKANQETVARSLGIEYQAHSAIEDVRCLKKIYKMLTEVDER